MRPCPARHGQRPAGGCLGPRPAAQQALRATGPRVDRVGDRTHGDPQAGRRVSACGSATTIASFALRARATGLAGCGCSAATPWAPRELALPDTEQVKGDSGLALRDLPEGGHGSPVPGATEQRPAHWRAPVHPARRVEGTPDRAGWPPGAAGGRPGPASSRPGARRRRGTAGCGRRPVWRTMSWCLPVNPGQFSRRSELCSTGYHGVLVTSAPGSCR